MAAPSGTVWGSTVGDYGRIGLYVTRSSTNTTTDVTIEIWFKSKYSVSDSANNLYFNNITDSDGSATTNRGSVSINTTVATGSGWSTSNEKKLKTYTYSYNRLTSSVTRYLYAKLADVDRVGGTMTVKTSFVVPALTAYAVKYNVNGGSGTFNNQTKYYGKALTLYTAKPTRTGYSFQGWSTGNDSSVEYAAGASYTANAAVTLYAVWKANTYSIKFNANGGSGAPSAQTKTYGVTLKLSKTIPTRTNYDFLGWSTSKTATSATYLAGGNYATNSGTTLYAVWKLAYVKPKITNVSVRRCSPEVDDSGNTTYLYDEEGTYAYVKFKAECYTTETISSIRIEWSSLNKGSGTASSGTDFALSNDGSSVKTFDGNVLIGNGNLDVETTYSIKITVTDAKGSNYINTSLSVMALAVDTLPGNAGVSFGKPAELAGVADFNFAIMPRKGFRNVPIDVLAAPGMGRLSNNKDANDDLPSTMLSTTDQTVVVTLSKPISDIANGILLVFGCQPTTADSPYAWQSFYISKDMALRDRYNGSGYSFMLITNSFGRIGSKYLYFNIDSDGYITIKGNDANEKSGTIGGTENGIKYDNAPFKLFYVYGV